MTTELDEFLDDLFLSCALDAFVAVALKQQAMPESEATRKLAYQLYEDSLREKNGLPPRPEASP